jgi:hypothetical protein
MAKHTKKVLRARSSSGWAVKSSSAAPAERTRNVHVIPSGAGWTVRREGAPRASKRFSTQDKAVAWARKSAKADATELVVHRRDGTIRSKDSYGADPLPPKDKK